MALMIARARGNSGSSMTTKRLHRRSVSSSSDDDDEEDPELPSPAHATSGAAPDKTAGPPTAPAEQPYRCPRHRRAAPAVPAANAAPSAAAPCRVLFRPLSLSHGSLTLHHRLNRLLLVHPGVPFHSPSASPAPIPAELRTAPLPLATAVATAVIASVDVASDASAAGCRCPPRRSTP